MRRVCSVLMVSAAQTSAATNYGSPCLSMTTRTWCDSKSNSSG
ncbi:hypothetical protein QEG98_10065 [Myxococcus sp. MxC21-1]|nr:hypothetical protein [Myxococcus sp. MxC21-1]WNZ64000.1 hypothetical protein QEG98_10065 [Myxococcus sp. MxC21-1]